MADQRFSYLQCQGVAEVPEDVTAIRVGASLSRTWRDWKYPVARLQVDFHLDRQPKGGRLLLEKVQSQVINEVCPPKMGFYLQFSSGELIVNKIVIDSWEIKLTITF